MQSVEESDNWESTEFEVEWDMSKYQFRKVDMTRKEGYKHQPVLLLYQVSGAYTG